MSFSTTTALVSYSGDASTLEFSVTFPFQFSDELAVIVTTAGVDETQVLNTDYTVGGAGQDSGGTVRFMTAPATGTTVTIHRNLDLNQERSFAYNGAFPTATVASSFDKAMQGLQQINEKLKRTFRTSEATAEIAPLTVADRAGKVLGFDVDGGATLYELEITALPNGATYDVATIAALKAISVGAIPNGKQVAVGGYSSAGDGGGGLFYYNNSSSDADNNGTIIAPTAGAGRWIRIYAGALNILWFGGKGDDSTDNAAAIGYAYSAITTSGAIYFPAGFYRYNSAISFASAKSIDIIGDGPMATVLRPNFAAGNSITVESAPRFSLLNISILSVINRNTSTYNIYVKTCTRVIVSNVYQENGRGGLFMFESVNFLQMVNCQGDSNDNTGGDTCLRLKSVGGTIANCAFRVGPFGSGGYAASKPCLHLTGVSTSLNFTNSNFQGGGPLTIKNISSITSTGSDFVVTTSSAHGFAAGDFFVIRNASVATYNTAWRIASVTSTTITVTTTANPGVATATGTAESLTACVLITSEDGAVNESRFNNCLFEAGQPNLDGTVGLYFNGRPTTAQISGWTVSNCYVDFGTIGVLIHGNTGNISNINIANLKSESICRGIHIESARAVNVTGFNPQTNQTSRADRISHPNDARTQDVFISAGTTSPYTRGIVISGSILGYCGDWSTLGRMKDNGIYLQGLSQAIHDIVVTGNTIFGTQLALNDDGTISNQTGWKIEGNVLQFGTIGTDAIPSVASATTVNAYPYHEVMKVTGTTNIQYINPSWAGKEIKLIFTAALSLVTGGNLAIAANYSVLQGQCVTLIHDGTSWYLK
jgi:hypothetical protein